MSFKFKLGIIAAALCLTACETTSQYTSGADYLSRYPAQSPVEAALHQSSYASASASASAVTATDASIRDIAAVEPDLRFPARIGLARIERHNLCLLYTSPSPRDATLSRMPSSA